MAKQIINLGQNANDGSGDTLRQAGQKINENFDLLFSFRDDSALTDAPADGVPYVRQDNQWVDFTPQVLDAPADGTPYARQDSAWVSIPSNLESPQDGKTYGRFNGAWAAVTEEAPADGTLYGRQDSDWVAISFEGYVTDAPSNGNAYVRQDSDWVSLGVVTGVSEAPADGQVYARQDSDWIDITSNLSASIPEAPTDGKSYGRNNSSWNAVVPEAPQDSAPYARENGAWVDITPDVIEAPVDGTPYVRQDGSWLQFFSDAESDGTAYGRLNGAWAPITLEAPADGNTYARKDSDWIDISAIIANGLTDANSDGTTYGRKDGAWVGVTEEAPNNALTFGRKGKEWVEVVPEAPDDGQLYVRIDKGWAAYEPEVEEAPQDNIPYVRYNSEWVDGSTFFTADSASPLDSASGGGIEEAPLDSSAYVRVNGQWELGDNYFSGGSGGTGITRVVQRIDVDTLLGWDSNEPTNSLEGIFLTVDSDTTDFVMNINAPSLGAQQLPIFIVKLPPLSGKADCETLKIHIEGDSDGGNYYASSVTPGPAYRPGYGSYPAYTIQSYYDLSDQQKALYTPYFVLFQPAPGDFIFNLKNVDSDGAFVGKLAPGLIGPGDLTLGLTYGLIKMIPKATTLTLYKNNHTWGEDLAQVYASNIATRSLFKSFQRTFSGWDSAGVFYDRRLW